MRRTPYHVLLKAQLMDEGNAELVTCFLVRCLGHLRLRVVRLALSVMRQEPMAVLGQALRRTPCHVPLRALLRGVGVVKPKRSWLEHCQDHLRLRVEVVAAVVWTTWGSLLLTRRVAPLVP